MKTKKSEEFVKRALQLSRAKFAVVGKGTQWTIYEGSDLTKATAEGEEMLIKCTCQKNKNVLNVVARGGSAELTCLKKVFQVQLQDDPKALKFKTVTDKDAEELEKLAAELAGPLAEQVAAVPEAQRAAVALLHEQAEDLVGDGELADARKKVAELKTSLAALQGDAGQKEPTSKGQDGKNPPKSGVDPATEWKTKLAEWTPALKEAMAANGPQAGAIAKLLAQATARARPDGNIAESLEMLNEARWLARRDTIEGPYLKAIKEQPGKADQLRTVLAYAEGKAESGEFGKAVLALDNLDKVLHAPAEASKDAPAAGLVKKRQFLADRWQKIPQEVSADLQKLKKAIESEMPDEDADELIDLTEDYLDDFYGEMKEAIDDDINSGDGQYKKAIGTIGSFRSEIASEPLIQHLKKNKLKVAITVESILLNALAEVEKALAS